MQAEGKLHVAHYWKPITLDAQDLATLPENINWDAFDQTIQERKI